MDDIQRFINEQISEFQYIDESVYLNQSRFESAVRGKTGVKGLQTEINKLCNIIKEEISVRVLELTSNKVKIDALSESYKLLFQDWKTQLSMSENELDLEIDKRISRYREELARVEWEKHKLIKSCYNKQFFLVK